MAHLGPEARRPKRPLLGCNRKFATVEAQVPLPTHSERFRIIRAMDAAYLDYFRKPEG